MPPRPSLHGARSAPVSAQTRIKSEASSIRPHRLCSYQHDLVPSAAALKAPAATCRPRAATAAANLDARWGSAYPRTATPFGPSP